MFLSILLLAVLFILSSIVVCYLPTKNLFSLFYSFIFKGNSSATAPTIGSSSAQAPRNLTKTHEHKKEEIQRVFSTFDKDGDGFITKEEFKESLKNLRLFTTEKETEDIIANLDTNKDGFVDFEEFQLLVNEGSLKTGLKEDEEDEEGDQVKEAFDVFDKDKDGLISAEELGLILRSLGLKEGLKVEDVKEMIRKVDDDGDGMVNFDEFNKMMKSKGII